MITKMLIRSLALPACVLALSACGSQDNDKSHPTQATADQAEMQKYNAYVEAANMGQASFAETLDTENGGAIFGHASGGIVLLRAA